MRRAALIFATMTVALVLTGGTALAARVRLRASGSTGALLRQYLDDLPMLFIVSQVELEDEAPGGEPLTIEVTRADGTRCPRCWRIVASVSTRPETAGLCERCVAAVTLA